MAPALQTFDELVRVSIPVHGPSAGADPWCSLAAPCRCASG